jgi:hypothetical protein
MTLQNGGEWCYAHKRYEPLNDQIDYPVSDTFLAYHYRNGQTHRAPPDYFLQDREVREEENLPRVEDLRLIDGLRQQIKNLNREIELLHEKKPTQENGGKREIQI